ncbi:hypothetical protein FRC17_000309 [Serendipita sp. 399]|nr:hypothetical protein FRC17_000309 [Serendipita sp. 399]
MAHIHNEVSSPEAAEAPQRSRNARAQARHRAKRKAYIERLEENVAKLQAVLGLSSDQLADLPPATVLTNRYAELEMENRQLHEQLRALQNAVQSGRIHLDGHNPTRWSPDSPTVSEFSQFTFVTTEDAQMCREAKKRKISFDAGVSYLSNDHSLLVRKPRNSDELLAQQLRFSSTTPASLGYSRWLGRPAPAASTPELWAAAPIEFPCAREDEPNHDQN